MEAIIKLAKEKNPAIRVLDYEAAPKQTSKKRKKNNAQRTAGTPAVLFRSARAAALSFLRRFSFGL